jgi:hypothetical protein
MSETELETAILLPGSLRFEETSDLTALRRTAIWTGERTASIVVGLARLIRRRWNQYLQAIVEAEVRRCGHRGVLADCLSAKSPL